MIIEAGIVAQFEAAHSLHGDFGPATRRHGHTYRVEVTVRGPTLRDDGTLVDLGILHEAVVRTTQTLDYRDLNELPRFSGRNSTAEVVAHYLCESVAPALAGRGLEAIHVRVWESPTAFAGWEMALEV